MRTFRRRMALVAAVGIGACTPTAGNRNPAPITIPRRQELSVTWLLARNADPTGRAAPDTLVVSPDTVGLRVGQHIQLGLTLHVVGLTETGDTVRSVIPVMNVDRSGAGIADLTEHGLRGVHPGLATVLVTPLLPPPGRAVITRVPVRVRRR